MTELLANELPFLMVLSARREFEERGDESELHIIIFDEIDSVN